MRRGLQETKASMTSVENVYVNVMQPQVIPTLAMPIAQTNLATVGIEAVLLL